MELYGDINISANEYCILIDSSVPVTADSFNVIIPRLMPNIKKGGSPKVSSDSLPADMCVNVKFKAKTKINLANHVNAKSATSLRTHHMGQVKEMASSKGESETETVPGIKLMHKPKGGPPHPPHTHKIVKPFEFKDMKYEGLNNIKIKNGTKMIGIFVGGNVDDFYVTFIPDVIPRS